MFEELSNISGSVDAAFMFIIGISLVMLVGITAVMIYFVFRYGRKRSNKVEEIEGNLTLELTWTIIPTILVLFMFWAGYKGFALMRQVPEDTMLVKVSARMWSWLFEYENGKKEGELIIPAGKAVRLAITSEDVLHSLFIPAFRVKEDAVPGQETSMWFVPNEPGEYDLFCTEYCGVGHSSMITKVKVLSEDEFSEWYEAAAPALAEGPHPGELLLREKGCIGCHSTDGTRLIGPSFKDIIGRTTTVMTDGAERTITTDVEYIKRSIHDPGADVVKDFPPIMPPVALSDKEIETIIEYLNIISGKAPIQAGPDGGQVLKEKGCLGCHSTDGTRLVGPSFKGIKGRTTTVVTDGAERTITTDAEYLKRSILEPGADVVKGFPPVMPPYQLSDAELNSIIGHLDGLR